MPRLFLVIALCQQLLPSAAADANYFEKSVLPILEKHCFDCHGEDSAKAGLRLDTTVGILRGGESGEPLMVRGISAESEIIKRVISKQSKEMMPPKGERLSNAEVAVLREWIDSSSKLPDEDAVMLQLRIKTDHWSFQPVKRPQGLASGLEIDQLIQAKLQEKGLTASQPTDKSTLIRRLYLVMHGMPPTPDEVADFIADKSADAYARLVDRVLDSPRYGERWARHWMDVVRYADTNGFETNRERKTAYHYRDFLISSFNVDKPYDQFIKEQLAGDAMGVDAATGFLVAGPYDVVKSPDKNLTLMQRQDVLTDMVNTTGTAFLGLTIGCARCHNHKFDPILQRDFYAMQAVFAGVSHGERELRETGTPTVRRELEALRSEQLTKQKQLDALRTKASLKQITNGKRPPVNYKFNEEFCVPIETKAVRFTILASSGSQPCIDELEVYDAAGKNIALGAKPSTSGTLVGYVIHQLKHINDGQTGNANSWISNTSGGGWVRLDFASPKRVERIVWSRDRDGRLRDRLPTKYRIEALRAGDQWQTIASSNNREVFKAKDDLSEDFIAYLAEADAIAARKLQADIATVNNRLSQLNKKAWVGNFNTKPAITHRLYRGEPMQQREAIAPDALSVLGTLSLDINEPDQSRRMKLADWIASAQNPLTARVMVNRLWHYIFGNGIVDTPSDFGANGTRPTHPELLDWLADEFVRSGWSMKHMQRCILLSAAFQQSSAPRSDAAAIDADARYLWRYQPRRLEAEAIRDSILASSGALDLKMGGPGFYLMDVIVENVMHYFPKEKYTPAEYRRMVYLFRIRAAQDGVFGSFDCPDGGSVMAKRSRSNTPLQALNLFNSSFILQQSEILAQRLQREAGGAPEAQVKLAFRLFFAREADAFELSNSLSMLRRHGAVAFARAMFNTSEFLFVL